MAPETQAVLNPTVGESIAPNVTGGLNARNFEIRRQKKEDLRQAAEPFIDIAAARAKYHSQRGQARLRGITWRFTFYQWLGFWIASGRWNMRGAAPLQYCMARRGDTGPYSVRNVYICTNDRNRADYSENTRAGLLSERELEVLDAIGRGEPMKTIAARLSLSASAVSTYRRRVLAKLDLTTNVQLIQYVMWFRKGASA